MAKLGILGGGQLAKMTAQAASVLNIDTVIFAPEADTPAAQVTPYYLVGQWHDANLLRQFASQCTVVTLESEFVDVAILQQIEEFGTPVYAAPATIAQVQDKLTQKRTMQAAGIPVPRFRNVQTAATVLEAAEEFGFPLILKARRNGYDGYGNVTLRRSADIPEALERLIGRELMVEEFVPFVRELAIMVARSRNGKMQFYPVVETIQQNHICHLVRCPASIDESTAYRVTEIAKLAVEAIQGVGVFGIELFELANGEVLYNELAPRPHNSGHYTIEGTITSQFENHVRAVMGWPLGDVAQIAPATTMVNILGDRSGTINPDALRDALSVEGAHIHLYGKREVRPGRKMGHITALGYTTDGAEGVARLALSKVKL
jgi:5-(carboxyamino)imidazole ribonucleotide synthase